MTTCYNVNVPIRQRVEGIDLTRNLGRGEEEGGGGVTRTNETTKWNEDLCVQVEVNRDFYYRSLG